MNTLLDKFAMVWGFLSDTSLSIPLAQVGLFVVAVTLFMLLGWHRVGLVVVLCFVFFWGFVAHMQSIVEALQQYSWGLLAYGLTGVALVVLIVLGLFSQREKN